MYANKLNKVNLYIAIFSTATKLLMTVLPVTKHQPLLYSLAADHHRLLSGTHCTYLCRYGQAELMWMAVK